MNTAFERQNYEHLPMFSGVLMSLAPYIYSGGCTCDDEDEAAEEKVE